ncbi:MAG: tetratricopeptide repeat protein, partial [Ktedonobacteraceae bacterium]|nr:tetratricopeptide repeat protein [Ktedonobacteraceae bacterium]
LSLLSKHDIIWRGMSLMHTGMEEQFAGHFNAARQIIAEARSLSMGNFHLLIAAILGLGNLYFEQGALQQARQYYRQALAETEKRKERTRDDQGFALLGLAQLAYEWNDLADARQKASQALANGRQLNNTSLQTQSALALARILHAQGEDEQAQQLLQELVAQIRRPRLLRELLLGQARLALACGDLATAQRWTPARTHPGTPIPFAQLEQEMMFKARLLIAQGAFHKALTLLNGWQREEFSRGVLENLVLSALAHAQLSSIEQSTAPQTNGTDHQFQARQRILRALELAQPEAFQRLFLDEGETMASLLRTILPEIRDTALHAYASNLALAFSKPGVTSASSAPASHLLSLQEQRVLHLLAAGHTRQAIAQELIVSLNTIKTHVKNIYRKLGAASREEACARARALRLLP